MNHSSSIQKIRIVLVGLGTVNIGVLKILIEKKAIIAKSHNLEIHVMGVADSSGIAIKENGYTYEELIHLKSNGNKVNQLEGYLSGVSIEQITNHIKADVLIDGSPVNLKTGNPGLQAIRNALSKGWSVVSANKAPLVLSYDELHQLAKKHGGKLAYSATVCGGLPVINILQRDLQATNLIGFKGIFNATTNFILEALEKDGSFDEAVKEAQRLGAAETDPSLDIDGYDTANKLYIIMKSFTDFSGTISDIQIEGIRAITSENIKQAAIQNKRIKLLAVAEKKADTWNLSVRPSKVEASSFIGNCDGWEMGIQLYTDYYEELSMKIYEEDPITTSAAVVRDLINISKKSF